MQGAAPCLNSAHVNFAKYFRTGLYTNLALSITLTQYGETSVAYTYTYRDLGMDHELSKQFLVKPARGKHNYWVYSLDNDRHYRVRGQSKLHDILFDYYRAHVAQVYADLGIDTIATT